MPERVRRKWYGKYVQRSAGRRSPFTHVERLKAGTEEDPRYYFQYFGGDNWRGLSGGDAVGFAGEEGRELEVPVQDPREVEE